MSEGDHRGGAGQEDRRFRGWVIPGPRVPGGLAPAPGESLDALCGHFKIFQLERGHRFSTDDILTAWYGTSWCPAAGSILDLGSGIGTVAMVAAWRCPGARVVTVEAQRASVELARRSVRFNGLEQRFDVREGDLREAGVIGAGERFDLVLGSPPYFPRGSGVESGHPQKVACRFELRGEIADYCGSAARHLAPGGVFACVFPVHPEAQAQRVVAAAESHGLTIVRRRDVILREGDAPLIGLWLMMCGADLPESMRSRSWVEPPLTVRCRDGGVHPEYAAVKLSFGFPP